MVNEIGTSRGGNAQPGDYYEDEKKLELVLAEENIPLFTNLRAFAVKMEGFRIAEVYGIHIETSEGILSWHHSLPTVPARHHWFSCRRGYQLGREGRKKFNEPIAPETTDKITMGSSVKWYSVEDDKPFSFPDFSYGVELNENNSEKVP